MITKQLDSKGRLSPGKKLANRVVLVDDSDETRRVVMPTVVLPEHEAWLSQNSEAIERVKRGLEETRSGQFAENPPKIPPRSEDKPLQ